MSKRKSQLIATLVAAVLVAAAGSTSGVEAAPGVPRPPSERGDERMPSAYRERFGLDAPQLSDEEGAQPYVVRLLEEPVLGYTGGIPGLAATAGPSAAAQNGRAPAARAYTRFLQDAQASVVDRASQTVGHALTPVAAMTFGDNMVVLELTRAEAIAVSKIPGVIGVGAMPDRFALTDTSRELINVDEVWATDPDGAGGLGETKGDGMVVGVIDTGIAAYNPQFADPAPDGTDIDNPLGDESYLGVCELDAAGDPLHWDPTWGPFPCNDKLIGIYSWPVTGDGSGVDTPGFDLVDHGSHTASTAVGNDVTVQPYGDPITIGGVAPDASVVMYGGCCGGNGLDLVAALDQAASDSFDGLLDVLNYSVGSSGAGNPYFDYDAVTFFYIRSFGTFVSVSNGNDGDGYYTTGSPASAPWVTSVGASSTSRYWNSTLTLPANSAGGPFTITAEAASDTVTAELVRADNDDLVCGEDTGHNYAGKIVFCDRGGNIAFVQKALNVHEQGAVGIVVQRLTGTPVVPLTFPIPGLYIDTADGADVSTWLTGDGGHIATIESDKFDDVGRQDVIADFSSRGPNEAVDVINPSLTAPGVEILASLIDLDSPVTVPAWGAISGTSMAAPHVAGAATLLRQLHPEWTPAEVQSALMTTALPVVNDLDGVTPADVYTQGSGRIDVARAADAGLLFDVAMAEYVSLNARDLNIPSFANSQCVQICEWDRTATVISAPGVTWSVDPDHQLTNADLAVDVQLDDSTPGALGIHVSADVTAMAIDDSAEARITLVPSDPSVPDVTLPLGVFAAYAEVPDLVAASTRRDAASTTFPMKSVPVVEFAGSVLGLTEADLIVGQVAEDPSNGDVFADLSQVSVHLVDVPANTDRLVVEVLDTPMDDLDLYVGGGAVPSSASTECTSASGGSAESCEVILPPAGSYWIVVQSFAGSSPGATDPYELAVASVSGADEGNASIVGPAPGATDYDVTVAWNLPDAQPGSVWYGTLELGSEPAEAGDYGYVPFTLYREADDVTVAASAGVAEPGDTVGYTVTIAPDVTGSDLTYDLSAAVPDGLLIDPATITGGGAAAGQTITWNDVPVAAGGGAVTLQYSVGVAADAPAGAATTTVTHITSDPFAVAEEATVDVTIAPAMLQPVPPKRLFDTRPTEPQGAIEVAKHTYGGGDVLKVNLLGVAGIGADNVAAVALNVTAVDPAGPGYVTVYPCNEQRPLVSNINFPGPGVYPNAVIAPVSAEGELCLYSKVQTHLIADVVGWFPEGAGIGTVTPTRLFDTRTTEPNGSIVVTKAPIGGEGNILRVKVAGVSGVPGTGAAAVALNVTAVNPVGPGYVTVYPCNGTRPFVSNVNFQGPGVYPNAVVAPLSPDGEVCFYSKVDTDLIADVNAWFPADSGFGAVTPVRLFDTRATEPNGLITVDKKQYGGDANILTVKVTGVGGVPEEGVGIVSLNVTAVNPTGPGYVTVYPCGPRPVVSNINFMGPGVYPNAVLTPVSDTGEVCFFSKVPTDLIADVNGWFAAP